ncbi:hypothetical protein FHP25_24340 [Vineibacter terrae]|uniref:Uncharacterized protein n=1 Tax=Vineibacter terrae TaxID=2586908 RepID=A0A5C8PH66_9HYPH|nr:hypothetical protein [Vineibacter terrae]TXL72685.1 hypothetical protein FHP25_24340 [Vineibacter terrae]
MSSGSTSTGTWQLRTKSRVTVNTKSALARYILSRKALTMSIVMSGRRAHSAGPQLAMLLSWNWSGSSGRKPLGCTSTAAATRSGARLMRFQMNGPPMQ